MLNYYSDLTCCSKQMAKFHISRDSRRDSQGKKLKEHSFRFSEKNKHRSAHGSYFVLKFLYSAQVFPYL